MSPPALSTPYKGQLALKFLGDAFIPHLTGAEEALVAGLRRVSFGEDGNLEATRASLRISSLIAAADATGLGFEVHAVTGIIVTEDAQSGRELLLDGPSGGYSGPAQWGGRGGGAIYAHDDLTRLHDKPTRAATVVEYLCEKG